MLYNRPTPFPSHFNNARPAWMGPAPILRMESAVGRLPRFTLLVSGYTIALSAGKITSIIPGYERALRLLAWQKVLTISASDSAYIFLEHVLCQGD